MKKLLNALDYSNQLMTDLIKVTIKMKRTMVFVNIVNAITLIVFIIFMIKGGLL